MDVAVDDLASGDLASQRLPEHESVETQQQLVVLGELVEEDAADGNELRRLATAFGRHAFNGVDEGFKLGMRDAQCGIRSRSSRGHEALTRRLRGGSGALRRRRWSLLTSAATGQLRRPRYDIHRHSPLGRLEILDWRREGGIAALRLSAQTFGFGDVEGFILGMHPFGVDIAVGWFIRCPEPAFRWAFQERFEDGRCDRHGISYPAPGFTKGPALRHDIAHDRPEHNERFLRALTF